MGIEISLNQTVFDIKTNDYAINQQQGTGNMQYYSVLNVGQSQQHKKGSGLWEEYKDLTHYIKDSQAGIDNKQFDSLWTLNITIPLLIDKRLQSPAIELKSEQKQQASETLEEIKSRVVQSKEDLNRAPGTEDKRHQTPGRAKRSNRSGDLAGLESVPTAHVYQESRNDSDKTTVEGITTPLMTSLVSATESPLQPWLDVLDEYVGKTTLAEVKKALLYYQSVRPEDDISGLLAKVDESLSFYQALNLIELTYFYAEAIKEYSPDTVQKYRALTNELSNALHQIIRMNEESAGWKKRAPGVNPIIRARLRNNLKKIDAISKTDAEAIQEFFRGYNERKCQIIYQAKNPLDGQAELKEFLNTEASSQNDRVLRLHSHVTHLTKSAML